MKRMLGMAVVVVVLGGSVHAMESEKKQETSTNNASTGEGKKNGMDWDLEEQRAEERVKARRAQSKQFWEDAERLWEEEDRPRREKEQLRRQEEERQQREQEQLQRQEEERRRQEEIYRRQEELARRLEAAVQNLERASKK